MHNFYNILMIIACLFFLAGYFRLIVDKDGNVDFLSYVISGCLMGVLYGMVTGTSDLFHRDFSRNAKSAFMIYIGLIPFVLLFSGVFSKQ